MAGLFSCAYTISMSTTCYSCHGSGQESHTEVEHDAGMSLAMGTALGMGYSPMTRTVTKYRSCTSCRGSGRRD